MRALYTHANWGFSKLNCSSVLMVTLVVFTPTSALLGYRLVKVTCQTRTLVNCVTRPSLNTDRNSPASVRLRENCRLWASVVTLENLREYASTP
jgi:hypothetical protein